MPSSNRSKKRVTPASMTLEKASEFWDKHSFLDYDDVQEVHFDVQLKGGKHFFAVERDLAKQIHSLAQRRGVSAETVVNLWLKAKLAEAA
ncbi:MAG: CopG family antitoxin [bacterium]